MIVNHDGRVITARRYPHLLALKSSLGKDGTPFIQGRSWNDPQSLTLVRDATGLAAELLEAKGKESFDVLPLSVATDGVIDYLGVDRRRFRPNLLVGGVQGLEERNWEGLALRIGSAVIRMVQLRKYGSRLSQEERAHLRKILDYNEKMLASVRVFSVHNGDSPASVFKSSIALKGKSPGS